MIRLVDVRTSPRRLRRLGLVSPLLGLALLLAAPRAGLPAAGFTVIVNAANPVSSLTGDEISRLFLKKTERWATGERVLPLDLTEQSPVRESFSKSIHGRSVAAIKAYWQKMIFSGRGVPPPEKPSSSDAMSYVQANSGAIGYVAAGTPLAAGVKGLQIRP